MSGLSVFVFCFFLFNIVLEVPASAKRHTDWKGKTTTLLTDDMIMCIENPKESFFFLIYH